MKNAGRPAPFLRWTAVVCVAAIWAMGLLAASPQLHASLHPDAGQTDHACAITLFGHGIDNAPSAVGSDHAPALVATDQLPVQPAMPVAGMHRRLPPACGPPVC